MPPKRKTSPKKLPPGLTWPQFRSEYSKNPYNGSVSDAWTQYKEDTGVQKKESPKQKKGKKKSSPKQKTPTKKKETIKTSSKRKSSPAKEKVKKNQQKILKDLRGIKSIQELVFDLGVSEDGSIRRIDFDDISVKDGEKIEEYITSNLKESTKIRAIAIYEHHVSVFVKTPKKNASQIRDSIVDQIEEEPIKGTGKKKFFLLDQVIESLGDENEEEEEETIEEPSLKEKAKRIVGGVKVLPTQKSPLKKKSPILKSALKTSQSTRKKKSLTYKKGYTPPDKSPIRAKEDKEYIESQRFNTTRTYRILENGETITGVGNADLIKKSFYENSGIKFGNQIKIQYSSKFKASAKQKYFTRYQKGSIAFFSDIDDNVVIQVNFESKDQVKAIRDLDIKVADFELKAPYGSLVYTFEPVSSSELNRDVSKAYGGSRRLSSVVGEILIKEKNNFVPVTKPLTKEEFEFLKQNIYDYEEELRNSTNDLIVIPALVHYIDGKTIRVDLVYNIPTLKYQAILELDDLFRNSIFTIKGKQYKLLFDTKENKDKYY